MVCQCRIIILSINAGMYELLIVVLTLRPDKNSVTVYEGDYAEICVSPDMLERDSPTLFYVLYDDKHYTANSKSYTFLQ